MFCEPATTATRDERRLRFERSSLEEGAAEVEGCKEDLGAGFVCGLVLGGPTGEPRVVLAEDDSEGVPPGLGEPEVR